MPEELENLERRRDAARHRARGLEKGKGCRVERDGSPNWKRNSPTSRPNATSSRPSGRTKRRLIASTGKMREELEKVRQEIEQAQRANDLSRASELRYGVLPQKETGAEGSRGENRQGEQGRQRLARAGGGHRRRNRRGGCPLDRRARRAGSSRANRKSCCASMPFSTSVSSARTKRCRLSPMR